MLIRQLLSLPRRSTYLFNSILLLAALGCGTSVSSAPTPTPAPAPAPTPPPTVTKAPIHGLVSMNGEGFNTNPALTPDNSLKEPYANPSVYTASVILVTWKQLQPTTTATLDTTAIESGLNYIAAYNTTHTSKPLTAKLRIFAGLNAPTWVMNLDGPPLTSPTNSGSIPRYWTPNYIAAWKSLQTQLAAVYDKDTRLQEVAVSGCASTTTEPFIHDAGTNAIPILKAAGFTDTQYQTCLSTMADQYAAWTVTPLDYTFNTFTGIDTGKDVVDATFPIQVMTAWRTGLGTTRGILANHGLQPTLTPDATAIYPTLNTLGPPLEFQSYGPNVDWNATIALGLTYHPTEIEIWNTTQAGGPATITLAQLQLWASEI